jgi:hypothetical protein
MKIKNEKFANQKLALGKDSYDVDKDGCVEIESAKKAFINILLKEGWIEVKSKKAEPIKEEPKEEKVSEKQPEKSQEDRKQEKTKPKRNRKKPAFVKGDK